MLTLWESQRQPINFAELATSMEGFQGVSQLRAHFFVQGYFTLHLTIVENRLKGALAVVAFFCISP